MIRYRHEIKYLVSEAQALAMAEYIRPFMYTDHHTSTGQYALVSLYLDSADLQLCRQSLAGLKSRFKLRIRSYSDDPDAPCYFEVKRRLNQIIVKSRSRAPRCMVAHLISDGVRRSSLRPYGADRNLDQFLFYQRELSAAPIMRVRYMRQAFESRFRDDVRMTFDRQLSLNPTPSPQLGLNGAGWQRLPQRAVVFEIKFTTGYPRWVCRMIQQFGLQPQSMSKYARSVAHACGMRLCAPRVCQGTNDGAILAIT